MSQSSVGSRPSLPQRNSGMNTMQYLSAVHSDPFLTSGDRRQMNDAEDPLAKKAAAADFRISQFEQRTLGTTLMLGAVLPYLTYAVLLLLFTYTYHVRPLWSWVFASLSMVSFVIAAYPHPTHHSLRTMWDYFPMLNGVLSICAAIACGLFVYWFMEIWIRAEYLREYSDVLPDSNPAVVADAGILHFAQLTVLDGSSSAGFREWPYTYCAAPIVTSDFSGDKPVGFWAVGVNCCEERSKFECGDADDAKARAGLRVGADSMNDLVLNSLFQSDAEKQEDDDGDDTHDWDYVKNYRKAVDQAAAAFGLTAANRVVYVTWSADPRAVADAYWWIATGVVFVFLFIGSIAACFFHRMLKTVNSLQRLGPIY